MLAGSLPHTLLPILFFLFALIPLSAQQLPAPSTLGDDLFVWNPAATAPERFGEVNARHRQEWLGFSDNPTTITLSGQSKIPRQSVGIGGLLQVDRTAALRRNTVALTYAYHIGASRRQRRSRRPRDRDHGQLSIGVLLGAEQLFVDFTDSRTTTANDPLTPLNENNQLAPKLGFGIEYRTRPGGPERGSYAYAGAAANQLLTNEVALDQQTEGGPSIRNVRHFNGYLGYRAVGESFTFDPRIWVATAANAAPWAQFTVTAERTGKYWGGLSYGFNQTASLQLGYVLADLGPGELRLGVQGTFNLGQAAGARGLGYGANIAYRFAQ